MVFDNWYTDKSHLYVQNYLFKKTCLPYLTYQHPGPGKAKSPIFSVVSNLYIIGKRKM